MSSDKNIFGLHNCDVRELREFLESQGCYKEFIDTTITSPPYYDAQSYGYENQIGYGQRYSEYLGSLEDIFRKINNFTRSTGSLWIIVDTITREGKLVNLPYELAERCKNGGWNLTDVIIWKKDKTRPWPKKGLRNIFEHILFFTKTKSYKFYADRIRILDFSQLKQWWVKWPERYNPKGVLPTNVWEFPIPAQGSWGGGSIRHFNPLPPRMIRRILLLTTNYGDVFFDPFAGSGIGLAVADFMGRRWLGFEMNRDYCNMFEKIVLREIAEELLAEQKRDDELEVMRENFAETIEKLRLVKFSRSLIGRLYKKKIWNSMRNSINTVFAISRRPTEDDLCAISENKFLIEDIFLVFDNVAETETLEREIKGIISKPPLSKFGIEPRILLDSTDEFVSKHRNRFDNSELWLYAYGVVHRFERKIAFSEWLSESERPRWRDYFKWGIPPIISNIRVNQKIPKTWKSKEEKFNILKQKYKEANESD